MGTAPKRIYFDVALLQKLEVAIGNVIEGHGTKGDCQYDFMVDNWEPARRLATSEAPEDALDAETIHLLFRDEYRLERLKPFLDDLKTSVSDLHERFKTRLGAISSKLSRGMTALPDEILAIIFDHAASSEGEGQRHAVWLSHVCRRFRNIVLRMSKLWTNLYSWATDDELEEVISRSGKSSDLHVVIRPESHHSAENIFHFLRKYMDTVHRWASLQIVSEEGGEGETTNSTLDLTLQRSLQRFPLDFSRLREIDIEQIIPPADMEASKRFMPIWTAPNLQVVRCENYLPVPSPSFSSVTSFYLSTALFGDDYPTFLEHLILFLGSAPNIVTLDLTLTTCENVESLQGVAEEKCPSITSFTLNFPALPVPRRPTHFPVRLVKALEMPKLVEYSMSFCLSEVKVADIAAHSDLNEVNIFGDIFLPDYTKHANLTTVSFEAECIGPDEESGPIFDRWNLVVSLKSIPQVSSFTLRSPKRPIFLADPGDGTCSLKEVCFKGWTRLDRHEIICTIASFADVGIWGSLQIVRFEDCKDYLSGEDLATIEGAGKIHIKRQDGTLLQF